MSPKKQSPSARGRSIPSRDARSQPRAHSSDGKQNGERALGNTAKLRRRLNDAGEKFYSDLDKGGIK